LKQAQLSLPPDSPTMDAIAVVDHLVVDDRLGRFLRQARLELAAIFM